MGHSEVDPSAAALSSKEPIAAESKPHERENDKPLEFDKVQPQDFEGELETNNELPSSEILKKIENYVVLDRYGKTHTFKSLYTGGNVARRVLIIFIRHFFCGNCQEYLRTLSESITPDALLRLPASTFIVVVGCGDPSLIDTYVSETKCTFPLYTDPKRSLFEALNMTRTWALGSKPAYMKKPMSRTIIGSVIQTLKQLPAGKALKSGDHFQVGGEFLFEPYDIATPITTPQDERTHAMAPFEEEKRVTWCHRMKTTRDHAEIPELMEVLGLAGNGEPI